MVAGLCRVVGIFFTHLRFRLEPNGSGCCALIIIRYFSVFADDDAVPSGMARILSIVCIFWCYNFRPQTLVMS